MPSYSDLNNNQDDHRPDTSKKQSGPPGYAFQWILDNANAAVLRRFMDTSFLQLLSKIDRSEMSESDLRAVATKMLDPREVLRSNDSRNLTLGCLPIEKARELASVLKIDGSGNVYQRLKGIQPTGQLYSFFGIRPEPEANKLTNAPTKSEIPSSYGLFNHQRDLANRAWTSLGNRPSKVILHMPTGSGKTRTAMHIVARILREKPNKVVVWLAHSTELLDQAAEEFEKSWQHLGDRNLGITRLWGSRSIDINEISDGLLVAGLGKLHSIFSRDYNAVASLASRTSLIIFDEAHQSIARTYKRLTESLHSGQPDTALIGLTATPGRTWEDVDQDAELSDFYDGNKVGLEIDGYDDPVTYLIDQKYLARPKFDQLKVQSDGEEFNTNDGVEYSETVLDALANDTNRNLTVVQAVQAAVLAHQRIIVFGATLGHAKTLSGILTRLGIEALLVTGETDNHSRQTAIRRFKSDFPNPIVMCNYGVLTTGFDAPKTSCAIIARPTKSLVLYSQMVGRATRGTAVGGNEEAHIITVIDTSLPGFGSLVQAFTNWEDIWNDN